jgi:tRNA pseudouridine55 synthase
LIDYLKTPRMSKNKSLSQFPPLIFNVFKPARVTSYDVIRHFKRHLPLGFGKIGHFGTLDPFASGVLLIGIGGAARLNDYIHELLPKTYIAVGKLGIETPTGDYESEISQRDESLYLKRDIASFPASFIQERLRAKFSGDYWQAPHKYSAAKFMGKNLHEWAREGVDVKKEPVLRKVWEIEVLRYQFPFLSIKVVVSSGTYVRTLFSHMANELGTIGSLIALSRQSIGNLQSQKALHQKHWPLNKDTGVITQASRVDEILPFSQALLLPPEVQSFKNGAFLDSSILQIKKNDHLSSKLIWMLDNEHKLLGLGELSSMGEIRPKINFAANEISSLSS